MNTLPNLDPPGPDWLPLSRVAPLLGLSEYMLQAGIAAGDIPLRVLAIGNGARRTTYVASADLARWRAACRAPLPSKLGSIAHAC